MFILVLANSRMVIDEKLLDDLSVPAKTSPRLRQAYNLRNTPEDNSQRMLNPLELGTVMLIHRHLASSETVFYFVAKYAGIYI